MESAMGSLTHDWLTHMLTDTKLHTRKPRQSAYRIADSNGLCIEVRPGGAKTWRYRYRYAGRRAMNCQMNHPADHLSAGG